MTPNRTIRLAGRCYLLAQYRVVLCKIILAILLSPAAVSVASASEPEQGAVLELGVAPFLPAHTLVNNYQPMRAYLEQQLKQPVMFVTASDYKTFYERTLRREYPIVITIASAAYLAHAEAGYVPMLRPMVNTSPVLVVSKNSSLARVQDLRGKTLALPDPLAVISMLGVQMLRESGFDPDKDLSLRHLPTHSAAVNHVISGEVAAAIISDRALLQMPADTQKSVRVIQGWQKVQVPGVVYLASPALPPERIAQLTEVILKFTHDTPEGRELMKRLGYDGLVPASVDDLKPLAPYGAMFKEALPKTDDITESE